MKENLTIQDIATRAGVSKTTVSRYLNGKYGNMSLKTKAKIKAIIEEVGYRPSKQAQYLKSKKSYLLGLLVADIENLYSAYLIKSVQDALEGTDYQILIMNTNNSKNAEQKALQKLLDQNIDGILLQPVSTNIEDFKLLQDAAIPTILIDRSLVNSHWTTVQSNNYQVTKELANHIIQLGYQRIIHVSEPIENISPRVERYDGMRVEAMTQNIPLDLVELKQKGYSLEAYLAAHPLKEKTAFFAANGNALYEVVATLKRLGLEIPKDCGVSGFDDWFWAELVPPGITTIHQNPHQIGLRAAELLVAEIQEGIPVERIEIPSELHIRHSL